MSRAKQLSRTTQLFQTDLGIEDAEIVLHALAGPKIVLTASDRVMRTRAGQSALLTAALLIARSGQRVHVHALDVALIGSQPPFAGRTLYDAIDNLRGELVDGNDIQLGFPIGAEIAFVFGSDYSVPPLQARRIVSVGWGAWFGELHDWPLQSRHSEADWPLGALTAAVLVAAEAIKPSAAALCRFVGHTGHYAEAFAPCRHARIAIAPEHTPRISSLGRFDVISAGAVSNALMYTLFRLPDVFGDARTFDRDFPDESNRNRNMLQLASLEHFSKVGIFQHFGRGLRIEAVPEHFGEIHLGALSDHVLVGVDDIRARWLLSRSRSGWMGVGATSHFNAMSSVHYAYTACAACVHPHDEEMAGQTPTISFVSFLAGLFVAADFLVDLSRSTATLSARYRYMTPLQTSHPFSGGVSARIDCPVKCPASQLLRRSA